MAALRHCASELALLPPSLASDGGGGTAEDGDAMMERRLERAVTSFVRQHVAELVDPSAEGDACLSSSLSTSFAARSLQREGGGASWRGGAGTPSFSHHDDEHHSGDGGVHHVTAAGSSHHMMDHRIIHLHNQHHVPPAMTEEASSSSSSHMKRELERHHAAMNRGAAGGGRRASIVVGGMPSSSSSQQRRLSVSGRGGVVPLPPPPFVSTSTASGDRPEASVAAGSSQGGERRAPAEEGEMTRSTRDLPADGSGPTTAASSVAPQPPLPFPVDFPERPGVVVSQPPDPRLASGGSEAANGGCGEAQQQQLLPGAVLDEGSPGSPAAPLTDGGAKTTAVTMGDRLRVNLANRRRSVAAAPVDDDVAEGGGGGMIAASIGDGGEANAGGRSPPPTDDPAGAMDDAAARRAMTSRRATMLPQDTAADVNPRQPFNGGETGMSSGQATTTSDPGGAKSEVRLRRSTAEEGSLRVLFTAAAEAGPPSAAAPLHSQAVLKSGEPAVSGRAGARRAAVDLMRANSYARARNILESDEVSTPAAKRQRLYLRVMRRIEVAYTFMCLPFILSTTGLVFSSTLYPKSVFPFAFDYSVLALDLFMFLFTVLLNLFAPFEDRGQVVSDPWKALWHNARQPSLYLYDVLVCFPYSVFFIATGQLQENYTRANLLLRSTRFNKLFDRAVDALPFAVHPVFRRSARILLDLVLITTCLASVLLLFFSHDDESPFIHSALHVFLPLHVNSSGAAIDPFTNVTAVVLGSSAHHESLTAEPFATTTAAVHHRAASVEQQHRAFVAFSGGVAGTPSSAGGGALSWENQFSIAKRDPALALTLYWREVFIAIAERYVRFPNDAAEVVIQLSILLWALLMYAMIVSSLEEMIVSSLVHGDLLSVKLEHAFEAMRGLDLPDDLQDEVVSYYTRMWEVCKSFDYKNSNDALQELPPELRHEIETEQNSRIIRTIPLFAKLADDADFVSLLAGQLQYMVVMPGSPIVERGEEGDCMFFIASGDAAAMDSTGTRQLRTYSAGSYFGEATMLFGGKRPNTIIAVTMCVCYVVADSQFEKVVDEYPEALQEILDAAILSVHQHSPLVADKPPADVAPTAPVVVVGGGDHRKSSLSSAATGVEHHHDHLLDPAARAPRPATAEGRRTADGHFHHHAHHDAISTGGVDSGSHHDDDNDFVSDATLLASFDDSRAVVDPIGGTMATSFQHALQEGDDSDSPAFPVAGGGPPPPGMASSPAARASFQSRLGGGRGRGGASGGGGNLSSFASRFSPGRGGSRRLLGATGGSGGGLSAVVSALLQGGSSAAAVQQQHSPSATAPGSGSDIGVTGGGGGAAMDGEMAAKVTALTQRLARKFRGHGGGGIIIESPPSMGSGDVEMSLPIALVASAGGGGSGSSESGGDTSAAAGAFPGGVHSTGSGTLDRYTPTKAESHTASAAGDSTSSFAGASAGSPRAGSSSRLTAARRMRGWSLVSSRLAPSLHAAAAAGAPPPIAAAAMASRFST